MKKQKFPIVWVTVTPNGDLLPLPHVEIEMSPELDGSGNPVWESRSTLLVGGTKFEIKIVIGKSAGKK